MHGGDFSLHTDVCAEAVQLRCMEKAVLEDIFCDCARTVCDGHQRHELGLKVSRKARMRLYVDINGLQTFAISLNAYTVVFHGRSHARLSKMLQQRCHFSSRRALKQNVSTSRGHSHSVGASLNTIRHDRIRHAFELIDALNTNSGRSLAFDLRAHRFQHVGNIDNFGLTRGVINGGIPFREGRSHHCVLCRADGRKRQINNRTVQSANSGGFDITLLDNNVGAHRFKGIKVKVHRARTDCAATRKRNRCMPDTPKKRTENVKCRSHLTHQIIWRDRRRDVGRVQAAGRIALWPVDVHAQRRKQARHKA